MNGTEIKNKIDENNKKIEEKMNPLVFTLNKEVAALMEENSKLRAQCTHEFKDGTCIYCYTEEN